MEKETKSSRKVNFIFSNAFSSILLLLYNQIYAKNSDKKTKQTKKENDDEPDATDEVLAQEPKSVDPFAAMPKG